MTDSASPLIEVDSPATTENAKLAAFAGVEEEPIEGVTFQPFSAMRRNLLAMMDNQLINSGEYVAAFKAAKPDWKDLLAKVDTDGKPIDDNAQEWQLMMMAVPNSAFHCASLAYICTTDEKTLSRATRSEEKFREAVFEFWNKFSAKQFSTVVARAFNELAISDIGNNYTIKPDDNGAKPEKN